MKIIREIKESELPKGLVDALTSKPGDEIGYCHVCDGIRLRDHTCVEFHPGAAAWAKKTFGETWRPLPSPEQRA